MKKIVKPILVTGSHRSGTTWAGQMLATAPNTAYILEPFHVDIEMAVLPRPFDHWFQCINEENEARYRPIFDRLFKYEYPLFSNLTKARTLTHLRTLLGKQRDFLSHRLNNDTPILKDPIAIFSAEWLAKTYDMNVLVMIRHPAAFCSSLKLKNWCFDFNNFLEQPIIIDTYLSKYADDIKDYAQNKKDLISHAILQWNCIYHVVNSYRTNHPTWMFVKHEDLSIEPICEFDKIYKAFTRGAFGDDFTAVS